MGKQRKIVWLLSFVMAMSLFVSCKQEEQEVHQVKKVNQNSLIETKTVMVDRGMVKKRDYYTGSITPYVEELYFAEDGVFDEYTVSLGETVCKGQVLAKIDTKVTEKKIKELTTQLEGITNTYQYEKKTLENEILVIEIALEITYQDIENAEYGTSAYTQLCVKAGNQVSSIERKKLELKQKLETYELEKPYFENQIRKLQEKVKQEGIIAPFDGVIVGISYLENGNAISKERPYLVIADCNQYLAVGEYVGKSIIAKAQDCFVFLNGIEYDAEYIPMDATDYQELVLKNETPYSTYFIHTSEELEFGQAALIVIVHESLEDVVRVPVYAVIQESARRYVYREVGEGREKVFIETGLNDGMYYEVISGIEEGDVLYVE